LKTWQFLAVQDRLSKPFGIPYVLQGCGKLRRTPFVSNKPFFCCNGGNQHAAAGASEFRRQPCAFKTWKYRSLIFANSQNCLIVNIVPLDPYSLLIAERPRWKKSKLSSQS
jgi:hypothetical protein